jgi:hypothetical protein
MTYPILADPGSNCDGQVLKNFATATQRTLATVEFVASECIIPDKIDIDEMLDIKIVYKLTTIEKRNYKGILAHFDSSYYDGGFSIENITIPIYIRYWIWHFSQMDLGVRQGITNPQYVVTQSQHRASMSPGQKFTWTFHGTITQLLGERPSQSGSVTVGWALTGWNYGWYDPSDFWPYNWNPPTNFFEECEGGCELTKTIQVNLIPTPPYPLFNLDLCSVSTESVAPNESFDIKVTIVNQNQYSGAYKIDCYCSGNKTNLVTGTIGGNATKIQTFSVMASQLANQEFTESQYIFPEIAVSNSGGETDRWPLAEIAVIVIPGSEIGTLSGRVTDKKTGLALSGVSVSTVSKMVMTNSSGNYALGELAVGPYNVKFSRAGYWAETKSKTIIAGENTLNLAMTPESEPPPDHEIPWELIALAGLGGVVAVVFIVAKKRGKQK